MSHTGALAGSDDVYDAAIRRAGMLRVYSTEDLFDAVETLARARPLRGERLAIMTNGGGPAVMAVDALTADRAAWRGCPMRRCESWTLFFPRRGRTAIPSISSAMRPPTAMCRRCRFCCRTNRRTACSSSMHRRRWCRAPRLLRLSRSVCTAGDAQCHRLLGRRRCGSQGEKHICSTPASRPTTRRKRRCTPSCRSCSTAAIRIC